MFLRFRIFLPVTPPNLELVFLSQKLVDQMAHVFEIALSHTKFLFLFKDVNGGIAEREVHTYRQIIKSCFRSGKKLAHELAKDWLQVIRCLNGDFHSSPLTVVLVSIVYMVNFSLEL